MLRYVKLDQLPEDLHFPDKLGERISYDAQARRLCFDGFMSKADFDKLVCLHNDAGYQRAIEKLFQICTFDEPPTERRRSLAVLLAGAAALVVTVAVMAALLLR